MKQTNTTIQFLLFTVALTLMMGSCKKQENTNNNTTQEETGSFKIEFEHLWGNDEFKPNTNLVHLYLNDTLNISTLRYYISNIKLKRTNGTYWSQKESYYLVDATVAEANVLTVTGVPKGEYTGISFMVGIDSTCNVSGAQTGALDTSNGMFWNRNSGYVFLKCEGKSPNSSSGKFTYHIGGFKGSSNAIKTLTLSFSGAVMTIKKTAMPQLHFGVNMMGLWNNVVRIKSTNSVTTPGTSAVNIATNFANMISLEHLHN